MAVSDDDDFDDKLDLGLKSLKVSFELKLSKLQQNDENDENEDIEINLLNEDYILNLLRIELNERKFLIKNIVINNNVKFDFFS